MFKKFFVLFLIGILAFTATGCSLFGDDDDDNNAAFTTISTSVKVPTLTGGSLRASDVIGEDGVLKSNTAKVTLTLSNGQTVNMAYDGNGRYTASISNLDFEGSEGFVIEAREGNLLVQNLVSDLANLANLSDDYLTNLESNSLTTAFAKIALTAAAVFAKNEGITTGVSTLSDFIKNVTNIKMEFSQLTTLKKEVTVPSNPKYLEHAKTRQIVEIALKHSDITAVTPNNGEPVKPLVDSLLEATDVAAVSTILTTLGIDIPASEVTTLEESVTWSEELTTAVETGVAEGTFGVDNSAQTATETVQLPAVSEDETRVKAAARIMFDAMIAHYSGKSYDASDTASLSSVLDDEFLNNGQNKTNILNMQPSDTPENITITSVEQFLTKIDEATYKVDMKAVLSVGGKAVTMDSRETGYSYSGKNPTEFTCKRLTPDFAEFPTLVRKQTNGSWKVYGNRAKIDYVDMFIQYRRQGTPSGENTGTSIWFNAGDTSNHRIVSGTMSGGNITGPIQLGKNPQETEWHIWNPAIDNSDRKATGYPFWTSGGSGLWALNTAHTAGQVYTVTLKFADNTSQVYKLTVPTPPTGIAPYAQGAVTIVTEDDKMKVSWPQASANYGFEGYEIAVWNDVGQRIISADWDDVTRTTAEFPFTGGTDPDSNNAYTLETGKNYTVMVQAFVSSSFTTSYNNNYTVLDPTTAAVKAMSEALNASTKTVAQGATGITAPTFTAGGGSIRAAAVAVNALSGLPTGTKFYDKYTAYAPIGEATNVFSIPSQFTGITHHLMQFIDATEEVITYKATAPYFSATPDKMGMLIVFSDTAKGLNMELSMDNQAVMTNVNADDYSFYFGAVGTITTRIGNDNYEIRMNAIMDVYKGDNKDVPPVAGMGLQGTMYKNNQVFKVDGEAVTIFNCGFNAEGIESGYLKAGNVNLGMFTRDNGVLKLILLDDQGHNGEVIDIQ